MRLVLETVRKAGDSLTAKEIALAIMQHKGFNVSDERTGGWSRSACSGS